jgi:putative endonuclease
MFYVYIIQSETNSSRYYGFTERKPKNRVIEHNGNPHHYTANKGPWVLIFLREFDSKREALLFEKKLKSLRNKEFIQREYALYFISR